MDDREKAVVERLDGQVNWYSQRGKYNQRAYKWLKVVAMTATGLVPAFAALGFSAAVEGCLGFVALLAESLQQMNQYHATWLTCSTTCAALTREKQLFIAKAGHYKGTEDTIGFLAEQVESLVSLEHSQIGADADQ